MDNSTDIILNWLNGQGKNINSAFPEHVYPFIKKPVCFSTINHKFDNSAAENSLINNIDPTKEIVFIKNSHNLGFAKANNLVIKIIINGHLNYDYIYLLNNDTIIEKDTISNLAGFMEQKKISVANSVIYEYNNRQKIAFAGGRLLPWGKAKYFFSLNDTDNRKSEFAHGCALMVKAEIFKKYGPLTEKFFHGEEDFEFSWRMKKNKIDMACVFSSNVYHKEGISVNKYLDKKVARLKLFALNRIIDMKSLYPMIFWHLWKYLVLIYFIKHFMVVGHQSFKKSLDHVIYIHKLINKINSVDRNIVNSVLDAKNV